MDEILASIRRIISDDEAEAGQGEAAAPSEAAPQSEDTTQIEATEESSVAPSGESIQDDILELTNELSQASLEPQPEVAEAEAVSAEATPEMAAEIDSSEPAPDDIMAEISAATEAALEQEVPAPEVVSETSPEPEVADASFEVADEEVEVGSPDLAADFDAALPGEEAVSLDAAEEPAVPEIDLGLGDTEGMDVEVMAEAADAEMPSGEDAPESVETSGLIAEAVEAIAMSSAEPAVETEPPVETEPAVEDEQPPVAEEAVEPPMADVAELSEAPLEEAASDEPVIEVMGGSEVEEDVLLEDAVGVVEEDEQPVEEVEQAADEPAAALDVSATDSPLEASVKEMLKPILREWLDENLPRILESAVKEEIGHSVDRSGG